MPRAPKSLIAGNWKMNGLLRSGTELQRMIAAARDLPADIDLLVCPPATLVARMAEFARGSRLAVGGQDCHAEPSGPFTGDISAEMLRDAGAQAVIVGHSERRSHHKETDADVRGKVLAAWRAGLLAIVCVGETSFEREADATLSRVERQLAESLPDNATAKTLAVAYEPVWAIGSGLTPSPKDVAEVHTFIRRTLSKRFGAESEGIRILYGGSVKPGNAGELLGADNVNGALVGGASLRADDFLGIARGLPSRIS